MPTPVDMPTLAVEVAFSAGANPNAWILGYSPLPVTLGEALVDTYTDVAAALRGPMRITRGKNRELEVYQPGRVSARLDNRDRKYDPLNLNGTHVSGGATLIKPGRRVRLKATHPTTAVQYDLLRGFVRDWQPEYLGQHDATTTLIATDALTDLSRTEIDLTTTAGLSGQAVAAVLTDAGVSGFDVDTGNSTFGAATLTGKAIEALRQMERAEQGQFYVERDGVVTFLERHALLQNDRHMRPQAYFGAGPFAGSAHNYLKGLSPAGLWGLGEASGDAVDESGNSNNGTVTYAAGQRDATALDYGGDGAITFDGTTTKIVIPAGAAIQNIFDGGGSLMFLINASGVAATSVSTIAVKGDVVGWQCYLFSELAGACILRFYHTFSGVDGGWETSTRIIQFGHRYAVQVLYDNSSTANTPTVRLFDLDTGVLTTLAVGSGLNQNQTPTGTRSSDAGTAITVGQWVTNTNWFEGTIDEIAAFKGTQPTLAQFTEWATLAATGIPTSPIDFTERDLKVASESDLIVNKVNVTRTGGVKQTASDADSEAAYGPSDLSYSDLPLASDTLSLNLAQFILGQKKDPAVRIRSVTIAPRRSAAIMTEALSRRLMDRIAVGFTPAGGGSAVLQECFIIGIEHEIDGSRDYMRTTFTLAPTEFVDTVWLLGRGRLGDTSGLDSTVLTSF